MQPLQSVQAEQMSALHAPDIDKHKEKDIEFRKLMRMEVIGSIVIFLLVSGIMFIVTKAVAQEGLIVALPIPGVLLYSYILTGIFLLSGNILYVRHQINKTKSSDPRYAVYSALRFTTDTFATLRGRVAVYLELVALMLVWPAWYFSKSIIYRHFVNVGNPWASASFVRLQRLDYLIAPIVSGVLVLLSVTARPPWGQNFYLRLFVMLLLVHVTLRQASYVLSLQPLQDGLRQSLGNPYIRLVAIAISDLISLTVAYGYLTSAHHFASISGCVDVMRSILSVQEVLDLLQTRDAAAIDYFMKSSGLLFYSTILSSVWQVKQFERNDKDYAVIGLRYLLQSRFMEAEQWFDRMRNPDKSMQKMRAMTYFAQGRLEDAIDAFQRSLDVSHAKNAADITFCALVDSAAFFDVDENAVRSLIAMGLNQKVNDSTMLYGLVTIMIVMSDVLQDVDLSASEKAYPTSMAFLKINNIETDDEIEEIYTDLCGKQPRDPVDKICVAGLIILVRSLKASMSEPDRDAFKHERAIRLEEILANTESLSQDIDKRKAVVFLFLLVNDLHDEPALRAQVVDCVFTIIKRIEESEMRDELMRRASVALESSSVPAQ